MAKKIKTDGTGLPSVGEIPKMPPVKPPKVAKEFEVKQIEELLNKIEESLGHYSKIGGPAPPFIKTDDDAIRDCLAQIRNEIKAG